MTVTADPVAPDPRIGAIFVGGTDDAFVHGLRAAFGDG